MTTALRCCMALLCAALCMTAPRAQEPPPSVPCRDCQSRGCLDCKAHGKDVLALERDVLFCSVAADCKSCGGALTTDCRICKNDAVEKAAEERKRLAQEWVKKKRAEVDAVLKNPEILHIKTAHVDLTFSVPPLTIGEDKVDTHRLMHLYARRLEELRTRYMTIFELTDKDFSTRLDIYMFKDPIDHRTIAPRVCGASGGASTGQKLMGVSAVYSMWYDKRSMPGDEGLHRSVVHNVTHLLLSNMKPERWLGNIKYGWIDEGLAHWFEDLVTQKCANFCYEEVALQPGVNFKSGKWRVPVRKLVESGKPKSFAQLSQLNTDQLTFEDHAMVFAYVDFLIAKHGGKQVADLIRAAKKGAAARDALQQTLNVNPLSFDEAFLAWVKATYPLEER